MLNRNGCPNSYLNFGLNTFPVLWAEIYFFFFREYIFKYLRIFFRFLLQNSSYKICKVAPNRDTSANTSGQRLLPDFKLSLKTPFNFYVNVHAWNFFATVTSLNLNRAKIKLKHTFKNICYLTKVFFFAK